MRGWNVYWKQYVYGLYMFMVEVAKEKSPTPSVMPLN